MNKRRFAFIRALELDLIHVSKNRSGQNIAIFNTGMQIKQTITHTNKHKQTNKHKHTNIQTNKQTQTYKQT